MAIWDPLLRAPGAGADEGIPYILEETLQARLLGRPSRPPILRPLFGALLGGPNEGIPYILEETLLPGPILGPWGGPKIGLPEAYLGPYSEALLGGPWAV